MYQNLDALDGKQARKLGLASPLGQLFDHGCDCCSSTLYFLNIACILKLGRSPFLFMFYMFCLNMIFYSSNWAEFFTHILRTNSNNVGVTEIHMMMIALNFLVAIFTDEIFQFTVFGYGFCSVFVFAIVIVMIVNMTPLMSEAWEKASDKKLFLKMLIPILSYVVVLFFAYFVKNSMFDKPNLTMALIFNLPFNILTIKIITASLTRMNYELVHLEIVGLFALVVLYSVVPSYFLCFVFAALIMTRLVTMAFGIIKDISGYLKINILLVPKNK